VSARRHNWPLIEREYIEGCTLGDEIVWLTMDEMCMRHGVNRRRVWEHARAGNWNEHRAAYQRRVDEQRQAERSTELARIAAELDLAAVEVARDGLALVTARIGELGAQSQQRADALAAEDDDALAANPPPVALELDRLARAADTWYVLGTRAVGLGPRAQLDVEWATPLDEDERDAMSVRMLRLLEQYVPEYLPPGFGDVIDLSPDGDDDNPDDAALRP
jgi:hypothetical protein